MIKVLVAERNLIVRCGFQSVLANAPECRIVADASSPGQLLWCLAGIAYDILLIEAGFLDQVGLATLEEYAIDVPVPRMIVYSHGHDTAQGIVMLQNGVHAYLTNRCSPLELREAISWVATGKSYIDGALAEEFASYVAVLPSALPQLLFSPCELRIYKMLALGLTLPGIAAQLNSSVVAINAHRARILKKMAPDGIAELVRRAGATEWSIHAGKSDAACLVQ